MDAVTLAAANAAATKRYTPQLLNSVAWIGDSITAMGLPLGVLNNPYRTTRGYMTWAAIWLRQRLVDLGNFGVSGERSDQIAARFPSVLNTGAAIIGLLCGTNDIKQSYSLTSIQANITTMLNQAQAARRLVVIGTVPPSTGYGTVENTTLLNLNDWIRRLPVTRGGVIVVDFYRVLVDSAGAFPAALQIGDGTHPSSAGAARMGKLWADTVGPFIQPIDRLETSVWNTASQLAIARANLTGNPLLTGTTGTLAGGATGSVASSWALRSQGGSGTIVAAASKVARTDFYPGEWQQIALTGGVAEVRQTVSTNLPAAGTKVRAAVEFSENAGVSGVISHGLTLRFFAPAFASELAEVHDAYVPSGDSWPTEIPVASGAMMTPEFAIPPNTGVIEATYWFGATTGSPTRTARISRLSVTTVP